LANGIATTSVTVVVTSDSVDGVGVGVDVVVTDGLVDVRVGLTVVDPTEGCGTGASSGEARPAEPNMRASARAPIPTVVTTANVRAPALPVRRPVV
jgi:hypothetical protein